MHLEALVPNEIRDVILNRCNDIPAVKAVGELETLDRSLGLAECKCSGMIRLARMWFVKRVTEDAANADASLIGKWRRVKVILNGKPSPSHVGVAYFRHVVSAFVPSPVEATAMQQMHEAR